MATKKQSPAPGQSRRTFLKQAATAAAAVTGVGAIGRARTGYSRDAPPTVTLVTAPSDALTQRPSVQWALEELGNTLASRGLRVEIKSDLREAESGSQRILASNGAGPLASRLLKQAGLKLPAVAEALALIEVRTGAREVVLACGSDARGLVYALLELADRARCAEDPVAELKSVRRIIEKPATRVRSVARLFTSELEDKPWFYDRSFWKRYLTELATHRFNRFSLTLGLGYDFPNDIRDAYFLFAYPFLVSPPGYEVRAVPLPETEREQNLQMLQFISEETSRRGLHFQLGIWTHAYKWIDSPKVNYMIEGLSPENHAAYCRDALAVLLRACPAISGVTFRVHGESGIAEGSYGFWKTVFEGVAQIGRPVEIDLHAKGLDQEMIDVALATGMPVSVSPKFWAEHMGLGYMQGAIRPLEMPPTETTDAGFFAKSSGSRRFLRYGYGDLLQENRRYAVLHRIWPGTQRLLLWGDAELAADYGRASGFCSSSGVEWCEPLSFKGRKGSGLAGGRNAYADSSLRPAGSDFEKYIYSYRVWGRRIYDPDCAPDQWERWLRRVFGARAVDSVQSALHPASRILPLFTTAHCPSAANNNYWPEMYTNMPIVEGKRPHPYGDTLSPKRFGAVSSLDPEFFLRIDDFAEGLVRGERTAKYTPAWVAASLESGASLATEALRVAGSKVVDPRDPQFRRLAADVAIQSGLGRFFATKLRAATLFALYERSRFLPALQQALQAYRQARAAWVQMAQDATGVYRDDVTFGPGKFQRGHWQDRLPEIEADLADMERLLKNAAEAKSDPGRAERARLVAAIKTILTQSPERHADQSSIVHEPAKGFRRGESLLVQLSFPPRNLRTRLDSVRLRYRRVNQAEAWRVIEMEMNRAGCHASISGEYTDSPFPLQYHFEAHEAGGRAWLHPGLRPGFAGQPYFVVRQAGGLNPPSPARGQSPASR